MTCLKVRPGRLSGTIYASPSKSHTHRAFVMGLLSPGESVIENPLMSEDTGATLGAIELLGGEVERGEGRVRVAADGGLRPPSVTIEVGNSGTTLRLIAGIAALIDGESVLDGDASVRKRPMAPLLDALAQLGARAESVSGDGCAPVRIAGKMTGTDVSIRGDVSSQFISSLLIALPLKESDTEVGLTSPMRSRGYVDMTMEMQRDFGIEVFAAPDGFSIPGGQEYEVGTYGVPGDFSSAAFPLCAGVVTGGPVTLRGLDPQTAQGDRVVLEVLGRFGADVTVHDDDGGVTVKSEPGSLAGCQVDCSDIPDLFPVLSVVGAYASGRTRLHGAPHLRFKESDRIKTTSAFLSAMGADVTELDDGLEITGDAPLRGASLGCQGDHRILMAAAVAALGAEGITTIDHGGCHAVSYPGFVADLRSLGAELEVGE